MTSTNFEMNTENGDTIKIDRILSIFLEVHETGRSRGLVIVTPDEARTVANKLIQAADEKDPPALPTFQVGDRVQLVTRQRPRHGWGAVKAFDVGTVRRVEDTGSVWVDFPVQSNWLAAPEELAKVASASQKVDPTVPPRTPRYTNLTDQAKTIYRHIQRAGSISAREAMSDYGITSATLARRICDLEDEGFEIARLQKTHPITRRKYTRYGFAGTRFS